MKFRKKPAVIEAEQFTGANPEESATYPILRIFVGHQFAVSWTVNKKPYISIETLDRDWIAEVGDWIIKDAKGEFSTCDPDTFMQAYEKVEE